MLTTLRRGTLALAKRPAGIVGALVLGSLGAGGAAIAATDGGLKTDSRHVKRLMLSADGIVRSSRAVGTFAINSIDYKVSALTNSLDKLKKEAPAEYARIRSEIHQRSADRILRLCEANRGIYIKAGQFIATLQQLPREYRTTLTVLQDQARGRPFYVIDRVFKEEFGKSSKEIFEHFEEEAIAAASLAQVHRATLPSGQQVAVKVQSPRLEEQVATDIYTMGFLSSPAPPSLIPLSSPGGAGAVPSPGGAGSNGHLHHGLGAISTAGGAGSNGHLHHGLSLAGCQMDFEKEGRNAELTAENFAHKEEVKVPKILWDFTTKRVLTMEFMNGCKIDDLEGIKKQGLNPLEVAALLVEVFAEMVFCHGHLHGDPHPGNVLIQAHAPGTTKPGQRKFDIGDPAGPWALQGDGRRLQKGFLPAVAPTHSVGPLYLSLALVPLPPVTVLLDHGLYREMDDGFRRDFCQLWRSLILTDMGGVQRWGERLGVGEYSRFLPALFTARPFQSKTRWGQRMSPEEEKSLRREIKAISPQDLTALVEGLPEDMFLVMRTDNLIRQHITALGATPKLRLQINGRFAVAGLAVRHSEEGHLTSNLAAYLRAQLDLAHLMLRIRAWEVAQTIIDLVRNDDGTTGEFSRHSSDNLRTSAARAADEDSRRSTQLDRNLFDLLHQSDSFPTSQSLLVTAASLTAAAALVFLHVDSAAAAADATAAASAAIAGGDAAAAATTWTNPLQQVVAAVEQGGDAAGPLGGAVYFAAAYAIAAVLLVPASILTLAAGYLFGAARGTAITLIAATLGASVAFLVARYAARPFVARQLAGRLGEGRFEALDRAISVGGWRIVLLCRLSPIFPFSISNYVFGITGIGFFEYMAASSLGMLPATFAYVYLGGAGRVALDAVTDATVTTTAAAGAGSGLDPVQVGLYVVGAVATLLVTREVSSRATKALEEAAAEASADAAGAAAAAAAAAATDGRVGKEE
ncbi:unnamed protein product [Closterium sp. NIES-65]|nr:unnamed protein product [Closterium sp. NIES-65]